MIINRLPIVFLILLLCSGCNLLIDIFGDGGINENDPTPQPTLFRTIMPSPVTSPGITDDPTEEPTAAPTADGTPGPSSESTVVPTAAPTVAPTPGAISIAGQWAVSDVTLPNSMVYDFRNDGICDVFSDYAMSILYDSVSYSVNETELNYGGTRYSLTLVNDNHFWINDAAKSLTIRMGNHKKSAQTSRYTPGANMDFYALGTEPGGHYENYFDKPPISISEGVWVEGSIDLYGDWIVYTFVAPVTSNYVIEWDDALNGSAFYTLDIAVSCYQSDHITPYFDYIDNGYESGQILPLIASELIYILIMPNYINEVGSFALRVTDAGTGAIYTIETFPNGGGNMADTYLILYDDSLTIIEENDDFSGFYSRISYLVQSGKTYYVEVSDAYSMSDYYSIQVSTTGGGGSSDIVPAQSEGEQDDSPVNAFTINIDTVYDRYLELEESDWFVFTIP